MMEWWMQLFFVLLVIPCFSCTVWNGSPRLSTEPVCPVEDGFFSLNYQCTREYYYCQGGIIIYQQLCPESDVFDPCSMTCVDPAICFDCSSNDGIYPYPTKCTSEYYQCTQGIPEKLTCPEGNIFDPVTYECTPAEQASCVIPIECTQDGYYPYPGACSGMYFLCAGGNSFTLYCPSDAVFDPSTSICVPIETASCTPGPNVTTTTTSTSSASSAAPTTLPTSTTIATLTTTPTPTSTTTPTITPPATTAPTITTPPTSTTTTTSATIKSTIAGSP